MAGYRYLTAEEQAAILAEIEAEQVAGPEIEHEAERAHYRRVILAKMRGDSDGAAEEYLPPDTKVADEAAVVLADEIGKG